MKFSLRGHFQTIFLLFDRKCENLSRVMNCFLKIPGCSIACKVTGKRVNRGAGYGLEIPVTYELIGAEKAVDWDEKKKCTKWYTKYTVYI